MMKQELTDAAEASGLSRDAIGYYSAANSCFYIWDLLFLVRY